MLFHYTLGHSDDFANTRDLILQDIGKISHSNNTTNVHHFHDVLYVLKWVKTTYMGQESTTVLGKNKTVSEARQKANIK